MVYYEFKRAITSLRNALSHADNQEKENITSYEKSRSIHLSKMSDSYINVIKRLSPRLNEIQHSNISKIQSLINNLDSDDKLKVIDEIISLMADINPPKTQEKAKISLPHEIKEEIQADINEIEKCMKSQCFRSATILCGRIMETVLHRKYYDITGFDILEKNPGIGLGKLIAKLAEKNVQLDPGLTQQIHLINQIRIFSVHKKKDPFNPSETQAKAIVLYTMDILEKLYNN